jgi:hypothetical protein
LSRMKCWKKTIVILSRYMRELWETGRFWLTYTSRRSWAFDSIYWEILDERVFDERGRDLLQTHKLWNTRLDLPTNDIREAMEPFVERKVLKPKEPVNN